MALQLVSTSQPVENERVLTTIDGRGVAARPMRRMALIGSVPAIAPSGSSTKIPLT